MRKINLFSLKVNNGFHNQNEIIQYVSFSGEIMFPFQEIQENNEILLPADKV